MAWPYCLPLPQLSRRHPTVLWWGWWGPLDTQRQGLGASPTHWVIVLALGASVYPSVKRTLHDCPPFLVLGLLRQDFKCESHRAVVRRGVRERMVESCGRVSGLVDRGGHSLLREVALARDPGGRLWRGPVSSFLVRDTQGSCQGGHCSVLVGPVSQNIGQTLLWPAKQVPHRSGPLWLSSSLPILL